MVSGLLLRTAISGFFLLISMISGKIETYTKQQIDQLFVIHNFDDPESVFCVQMPRFASL